MPHNKPVAPACDRNRDPILACIKPILEKTTSVLEIGSGTGQHAVFFAEALPWLKWQPSDRQENLAGIDSWVQDAALANLAPPVCLDMDDDHWPSTDFDAVFSANTVHIMHWPQVMRLFAGIGRILNMGGYFMLYGPFNYDGHFSSESNARFQGWLQERDPNSGIRDFEALDKLARLAGMILEADYEMPSNNRILCWRKN